MKCVTNGEPKQADKKHINRYKMAHMIGVAEYMRENAEKYGLDPDKMYAVGLLHDIGYLRGRIGHEINSIEIAQLADEMANTAILCHGLSPVTVAKEQYFAPIYELLEKNPILVLLYEADMSIDAMGYNVGYYGRLNDIGERYGYDHIAYETACETVTYLKGLEMLDAFKDISAVDTDRIYNFGSYIRLLPLKENGIKQFTMDELFSKLLLNCIPIKETSIAKIVESLKEEMEKKYLIVPIPYDIVHGKEKGKRLIRFYLCELPEDYNKEIYHQLRYKIALKRGQDYLKNLVTSEYYEIIKDNEKYDNGLLLIEYENAELKKITKHFCIDLVDFM